MMNRVKAIKKSRKLYICMALNVIEGLMSGSNFTTLYFLLNAILQNDLTKEKLMKYASILGMIFVLRLIIYSTAYTGCHIAGAEITEKIRLFLGNKKKKNTII